MHTASSGKFNLYAESAKLHVSLFQREISASVWSGIHLMWSTYWYHTLFLILANKYKGKVLSDVSGTQIDESNMRKEGIVTCRPSSFAHSTQHECNRSKRYKIGCACSMHGSSELLMNSQIEESIGRRHPNL
jgi:hypothetical protein